MKENIYLHRSITRNLARIGAKGLYTKDRSTYFLFNNGSVLKLTDNAIANAHCCTHTNISYICDGGCWTYYDHKHQAYIEYSYGDHAMVHGEKFFLRFGRYCYRHFSELSCCSSNAWNTHVEVSLYESVEECFGSITDAIEWCKA